MDVGENLPSFRDPRTPVTSRMRGRVHIQLHIDVPLGNRVDINARRQDSIADRTKVLRVSSDGFLGPGQMQNP